MTYSSESEDGMLPVWGPVPKTVSLDEGKAGNTGSQGQKEAGKELGLRGRCETFLSLPQAFTSFIPVINGAPWPFSAVPLIGSDCSEVWLISGINLH